MHRDLLNEFKIYKPIAIKIFNGLNGVVNYINKSAVLDGIHFIDNIYNNLALIRYPNNITLFLGGILDTLQDAPECSYHNMVCSLIAVCFTHELLHTDQLLSVIEYSGNKEYMNTIESAVEKESYHWLNRNRDWVRSQLGFDLNLSFCPQEYKINDNSFYRVDAENYYRQTIANIIFRSRTLEVELERVFADDNIIISFNNSSDIVIKMNGIYIEENIPAFSTLVYSFAGTWDRYTLDSHIGSKLYRDVMWTLLDFSFSNELFNPVRFGK